LLGKACLRRQGGFPQALRIIRLVQVVILEKKVTREHLTLDEVERPAFISQTNPATWRVLYFG